MHTPRVVGRGHGGPLGLFMFALLSGCAHSPGSVSIRLYALDCGRMLTNGVQASDPCFLVRHPKGDLLWDTGLPQSMADAPGGVTNRGQVQITLHRKITDMLEQVQLTPADIEYLAMSHTHFDHIGNASLFAAATWLVDHEEREWAFRPAARLLPGFAAYRDLEHVRTREIEGDSDFDVFGDGSVTIIQAPGHTPGHTVLLLQLAHAGPVLLAGDLWNTTQSGADGRGSAQVLESRNKIEALIAARRARRVRQHVLEDFEALPRYPAFLD